MKKGKDRTDSEDLEVLADKFIVRGCLQGSEKGNDQSGKTKQGNKN